MKWETKLYCMDRNRKGQEVAAARETKTRHYKRGKKGKAGALHKSRWWRFDGVAVKEIECIREQNHEWCIKEKTVWVIGAGCGFEGGSLEKRILLKGGRKAIGNKREMEDQWDEERIEGKYVRLEATERSYSWTSVTGREQMNMRGMNEENDVYMSRKEELEGERK